MDRMPCILDKVVNDRGLLEMKKSTMRSVVWGESLDPVKFEPTTRILFRCYYTTTAVIKRCCYFPWIVRVLEFLETWK
jgi:hypothetical protein